PVTFDEALAALLALVGERVEVHVMDAGETPHLVATFGGRLRAGYSMTGGEPGDNEAIFVRFEAGEETAAISLDREVFEGGIARGRRPHAPAGRRRVRDRPTGVMDTAGDVAGAPWGGGRSS